MVAPIPTPRIDKVAAEMPPGDPLGAIIMALEEGRRLERENVSLRQQLRAAAREAGETARDGAVEERWRAQAERDGVPPGSF